MTRASLREYAAVQRERNPLHLRRQLDRELDRLWALAAPEPHRLLGQTSIATPSQLRVPEALRLCPR